jgi:hypothetical protein
VEDFKIDFINEHPSQLEVIKLGFVDGGVRLSASEELADTPQDPILFCFRI